MKSSKFKVQSSKIRRIKLLILDVDGVMTDGSLIYDSQGNEYKIFNVHDGYGIELLKKKGIRVVFISGKRSAIIDKRAEQLGIKDVYQEVNDKVSMLSELLNRYKLTLNEVCAVGDDLLDMELLKKIGFPVAVRNARPEVKRIAKYITKAEGGKGAVRELADLFLTV